jgi:1-acylglycerone phosphate reductase
MSPSKKPSILITGYVNLAYLPSTLPYTYFISCSQGGAGNALALEFAARGLRVFATARSLESMSNLPENGIETLALDVTVSDSILSLKEEISKRTGGTLDYLYNNAGESKYLGSMQKIAGLHVFVFVLP